MNLFDLRHALIADYELNGKRTMRRALEALRHFEQPFEGLELAQVDYRRLSAYVEARRRAGIMPATIRYELSMLKRGWRELSKLGGPPLPIFPSIRVQNTRTGFFSDEEVARVVAALPCYLRNFIQFLAMTGWRVGEARGLKWSALDWTSCTVRLEAGETKTGRARLFPFGQFLQLRRVLEAQRRDWEYYQHEIRAVIPWIFFTFNQESIGKRIGDFRKAWATACKAAGCPGRLVHDLRRSAVRRLTRAGVPRVIAKQLTGHRTDSVYERYDIVDEADLGEAARKLSEALDKK